jgi:hypothetical protein
VGLALEEESWRAKLRGSVAPLYRASWEVSGDLRAKSLP